MSDLGSVLLGDPNDGADRQPTLRTGVVTATQPLAVRVGSASTAQACRSLASYSGTVGDTVQVLVVDGDRVVLGRTRSSAPNQYRAQNGNTGTTAGTTPSTLSSISMGAQGVPGYYFVQADALLTFTTGGDNFELSIQVSGVEFGNARIIQNTGGQYVTSAFIQHDGVTAQTIDLKLTRTGGTGTSSFFGSDVRYMHLHTIFFPMG